MFQVPEKCGNQKAMLGSSNVISEMIPRRHVTKVGSLYEYCVGYCPLSEECLMHMTFRELDLLSFHAIGCHFSDSCVTILFY
jgi:hypothetical protein